MRKILIIIMISVLLVGCGSKNIQVEPTIENSNKVESTLLPMESVYPSSNNQVPNQGINSGSYPAPQNENPQNYKLGPDFKIERPVISGAKTINGTGPIDVPIKLIDVSNMGEELAFTKIDKEGKFSFDLSSPLSKNTTIAIQLGDVNGTKFDPSDFFYSPNYIDKPMIGILFDMVIVE